MKRFFINILLILIPLTIIFYGLDYIISAGLRKSDNYLFQTWNKILDSDPHPQLIINGNSRAWVQIDPLIIDTTLHTNSYNIGADAYSFDLQYFRYNVFAENNDKPKQIIQCVDIYLFGGNKIDKEQFFPYIHKKRFREVVNSHLDLSERILPFVRYSGKTNLISDGIKSYFDINEEQSSIYKGYQAVNDTWNGSSLSKIRDENNSILNDMDKKKIAMFDQFLKQCKKEDIEVFLVYAPQYYEITKSTHMQRFIDLMELFSEKYKFPFLDYTNSPECKDTNLFYNGMHLNVQGSKLFSLKLAQDLKDLEKNH